MIVLSDTLEKVKYRAIENNLFNINSNEEDPEKIIKKEFISKERFDHAWLGHEDLFIKLQTEFGKKHPEFCIATIVEDDPIYLFDLTKDTLWEYNGIMNYPGQLGLTYPDPNVGYSILYEEIFIYNPNQCWCLYSNRYYDIIILAY